MSEKNGQEYLSFSDLVVQLGVSEDALLALLRDGDAEFSPIEGDPQTYRYTMDDLDRIREFKPSLRLPFGNPNEGLTADQRCVLSRELAQYVPFDVEE
jgi:hypothetical protein